MLPLQHHDKDDKHEKYRRWLYWKGSRWLFSTLTYSTPFFCVPFIGLVVYCTQFRTEETPSFEMTRFWLLLGSLALISIVGWIADLVRKAYAFPMSCLAILGAVCVTQLLVIVMFGIPLFETIRMDLDDAVVPMVLTTDENTNSLRQEGTNPLVGNTLASPRWAALRGKNVDLISANVRAEKGIQNETRHVDAIYSKKRPDGIEDDESLTVLPSVTRKVPLLPSSGMDAAAARWERLLAGLPLTDDHLAQMSHEQIAEAHMRHHESGVVSVILAAYNEHLYTTRTLQSILNTTRPGLLKEILIIDDASEPPMKESFDSNLYHPPLVNVVRNPSRVGLIRSKTIGGDVSTGEVLVFLDAHVRPDPLWVYPILRHIGKNYRRVVVPKIPILNGTTWEINRHAVGEKMMFDWDMSFNWVQYAGEKVPCMSGGLLAISRRWWEESGALDTGMELWGAENIEQSIRIWLCGGEIVVAPDCVIAHVFRPSFPYSIDSTKILQNKIRTAEVWFDEYKEFFYDAIGSHARRWQPKVPLPNSGEGFAVDPSVESVAPFQNISERLALRESLQCKPFKWYVNLFEDLFEDRGMLPVASFSIRHRSSGLCLQPVETSIIGVVTAAPCDEDAIEQRWTFRRGRNAIRHVKKRHCLDLAAGKMPSAWASYAVKNNSRVPPGPPPHHPIELFPCEDGNTNQEFWEFHGNTTTTLMFNHRLCLQLNQQAAAADQQRHMPHIVATVCKQPDSAVVSDIEAQEFERVFDKVLSPKELRHS